MARAAKVPPVVQEFKVTAGAAWYIVTELSDRNVALVERRADADNIAAALNLWMAIERGEVVVKEAE